MKALRRWLGWVGAVACALVLGTAQAQAVTYFHNDVSGTPVLATDASGNVVWKEAYKPYGERVNNPAAEANNPIGYAGKPYDAGTGLSYMGARYYDPVLGRFLGVDPRGVDPNDLFSFNRYAYANNNPYRYVDPNGRSAVLMVEIGLGVLFLGGVHYASSPPEQQAQMRRAWSIYWQNVFSHGEDQGGEAAPADKGKESDKGVANTTPGSPEPNGDNDGDKPKKGKSVNQINNDVKKDKAPDGIKRADTGKVTGEQDHVHLDNGNALNRDGTWKHVNSGQGLTRAQEKYLVDAGWKLPK
ncbi:RHS repeat domain-containing protein [Piscinibacter terrae]|uniref:Teneurin-like YD-shell domain-containing protein n=1 Tax=Piscinibacter terrae TaxID=2496871 RepID=A0A3N7HR96_9BURK|nr:RHS repeat-associated core domain-containing protein [Albitalea terrae]RQP24788.1 hypothetical protein DZC73_07855 [Albitalea terrae]